MLRVLCSLLLVTACSTPDPRDEVLEHGFAPLPYTAEEVRDAHPDGTLLRFRAEAEGTPTVYNTMIFSEGDAEGTTVTTEVRAEDGTPIGRSPGTRTTWDELRMHAAFPARKTSRRTEACEVPAGTYTCWLYTVSRDDGSTSRYWFAHQKPGPPVRFETERDGTLVTKNVLVNHVVND